MFIRFSCFKHIFKNVHYISTDTCSVDDDCEDDVEHCVAFECVCNTGYHYRPGTVICESKFALFIIVPHHSSDILL